MAPLSTLLVIEAFSGYYRSGDLCGDHSGHHLDAHSDDHLDDPWNRGVDLDVDHQIGCDHDHDPFDQDDRDLSDHDFDRNDSMCVRYWFYSEGFSLFDLRSDDDSKLHRFHLYIGCIPPHVLVFWM